MFLNVYEGKNVLLTGHTGFKGTWLSFWLDRLGAKVTGMSNGESETPSFFQEVGFPSLQRDLRGDVRDIACVIAAMEAAKPDFVFHLAAQSVVSRSFEAPADTFTTNSMGTANVLEAQRRLGFKGVGVFVTSDKCYRNVSREEGYSEDDELGGSDPYSASKACAEIIFSSYVESFFQDSGARLATVRAGNVIGGGDWTRDRIVPDAIRSWSNSEPATMRMPRATRPWQHVLEPLSGYLWLGASLFTQGQLRHNSFNFGPSDSSHYSVADLLQELALHWPGAKVAPSAVSANFRESPLLALNCTRSFETLGWWPTLDFTETCRLTTEWYQAVHGRKTPMRDITGAQLDEYQRLAIERALTWAMP